MLHGSHLMIGVGTFIALSPILGFSVTGLGLLAVLIGSLIPDIDHPKSFISHWNAFTQMLSRGVSTVTSHRGLTHTIYGLFIWAGVIYFVLAYFNLPWMHPIMIGGVIGYFSHLAIDSLNPQGVRWLGKSGKVHLKGPINTGGLMEKYLVPIIFIGLALVYLNLARGVEPPSLN